MYRTDFSTVKKPVKREDFEDLLQDVAAAAYHEGLNDMDNQHKRKQLADRSELLAAQSKARLEALNALTKYANATGQTMQSFAEAMKSEAGQL